MKHEGKQFIQRLLSDDSEAIEQFSRHYGLLAKSKAQAAGLRPEDAEEVSQETLIRVLQSVRAQQGLKDPRKLGAFVHGTAKNVIAEFRRANSKHHSPVRENEVPASSGDCSPERQLWNGEFQQQCDQVLDAVHPRYRRFLCDYYIRGLDTKSLCRNWRITPGNCRVLHHRALKAFATQAERQGVLSELLEMMRNKPG